MSGSRSLEGLENLRLIAISGHGTEADRHRSRSGGFEVHLVKPVELSKLKEALDADRPGGGARDGTLS